MKGFLNFVGIAFVAMVIVGACSDGRTDAQATQRQVLASRLQENDGSRNLLVRTIEGRRSQVAYLEGQVARQRNEMTHYRGQVEAYMMDHKMAIAALVVGGAGIGVALNDGNTFTPDEEFVGGVVAFIAAAYALANAQEVMQVADVLVQADTHFRRLESQLGDLQHQLQNERTQLQLEEQQLAALNQQSDHLRTQLAALS
jgi:septal ring factor EnvC (AmiA/AmiB activator)